MFNPRAPRRKFGNTKVTTVDGLKFDSKKEAQRWAILKKRQEDGLISKLERQKKIRLFDGFKTTKKVTAETIRPIDYTADFVYEKDAVVIIEDVKASKFLLTPVYKLKRKLLLAILEREGRKYEFLEIYDVFS